MISQLKPARRTKASKATTATVKFDPRACTLDRLADLELQMGHHAAAEHLARHAAELREGVR